MGELAHERNAFNSRNVRVIGISVDTPEASRKFAKEYKIPYPLIEDKDAALSKAYVGVDDNGYAVPGLIILNPDGQIALRRLGVAPGDRIYAQQLLQIVDDIADKHALAQADSRSPTGAYAPLERAELYLGVAAGYRQSSSDDDDGGFAMHGTLSAMFPINRYVLLGGLVRGVGWSARRFDIDAAVRFRLPTLYDNSALYLQIPFGAGVQSTDDAIAGQTQRIGWNTGVGIGTQFAFKPSIAIVLQADVTYHRFAGRRGASALTELRYTAGGGLAWLF